MKSLQCDRCGGLLPFQEEPGGRCARCLLEMGVGENTQKLEDADPQIPAGHLNAGTYVGRYRILRPIGDGGMGVVYEAEQEQPRRRVALKLIRPGMAGKATLRRFERETQALGRLQHPGIAQIYDAGAVRTGFGPQPYFAMELIRGRTPGEYVKQHQLSVRERLELVAKVAEAVHHAHQRGIIHRDLKPSNILVDETGQPKVLDFGVSRAIDDSAAHTHQTEMGQLLGTVAYMSPEQVTGDPHEIDIRTDIYALGVILYELLAGRPPYSVEGNLHEALTAVREAEPTPLGTLVRDFKGDIETIAAKALEKDKNRRYTSAAELAADIRRFLSEQPIIARPQTATYQLKKFARRHKVVVTAAAVVTAALLLGVVISTWQARRAGIAEQAALVDRDRALQAEAVSNEQRNLALEAQRQALAAGETATAERDRANLERNRAQNSEGQALREARVAKTQRLMAITQYLIREALRPETARDDYDLASALVVQAQRFSTRISAEPRQAVEDALQKAMLWNPLRHNLVSGGNNAYRSVAFSPDGDWLAAGGSDETVRVWNMGHPAETALLLDAKALSVPLPRGTSVNPNRRVTPKEFVYSADLTRALDATGNTLRLWDLRPAAPLAATLEGHPQPSLDPNVYADRTISFCRNGTRVALSSRGVDGYWLSVWDLDAEVVKPRLVTSFSLSFTSPRMACSPDGTRLAIAQFQTLRIVDITRLNGNSVIIPIPSAVEISGLVFSPDGNTLAGGMGQAAYLWNVRDSKAVLQILPMPLPAIPAIFAFSSDDSRFAASSGPNIGQAAVWNLKSPHAPPQQLPSSLVMAFSHDGNRLATSTEGTLRIWDLSNPGAPSVNLQWKGGSVIALAFTPDNLMLEGPAIWMEELVKCAYGPLPPTPYAHGSGETLSMKEWEAHIGEGIPYERTCPNLPAGAGTPGEPK